MQIKNTTAILPYLLPATKTREKEKVHLGGVRHAHKRSLDLKVTPQKTNDGLEKLLWTDEKVSLSRAALGKKASLSKEATGRSETCNKATKIKLKNSLPLAAQVF